MVFAAIIDEREEFGHIQSLFRDAETNGNEIERFYEISMRFYGILWDSMRFYEIL